VEDERYWQKCLAILRDLPANVSIECNGNLDHSEVLAVLPAHHLFLLPTLGENYGHSIVEALSAGVPVLISDQTPWTTVNECGAGWALPLNSESKFSDVLQAVVDMGPEEYGQFRFRALEYFNMHCSPDNALSANRRLFSGL
jgi:glycosyltransferase involved in cell wall biosynthesis